MLKVNLRHLDEHEVHLQGELPVTELDLGVNDELVRAEKPLRYDLSVELLHDAVLATGSLVLPLDCECARCLKKFKTELMGILPPFEALKIARERGLDLVEVSPNAVPPVCRIQDYGRFLYEKEKSERAARKKQKVITIKEVKFSVTVDEHDYQTKKNQAVKFLAGGDKVKASLRFRGRQMAHRELGYAIVNRLIQDIGDAGIVEFMPRMEGTILHAILAPSKKQEAPKPKPAAAAPQASAPAVQA